MKTISLIILLLLPAAALAVPSISGVSGNMDDDASITISGSGFGSKSPAAPKRWTDFNGGTVGELLDEDGWYITYSTAAPCYPEYSQTETRDGTKTGRFCGSTTWPQGYQFQTMRTNGPIITDQKCFVSMKMWFDWGTNFGGPDNSKVKLLYFFPSTGDYSDDPELQWVAEYYVAQGYGNARWSRYPVPDCGFYDAPTQYSSAPRHQQWNDLHIVFDKGSRDTEDTYLQQMLNYNYREEGSLQNTHMECTGGLTMNRFMIGAYMSNVPTQNELLQIYYDDVYVDDTWSRVEIGDKPDYYNCIHREMLIPTAWADGSITATVNLGTFTTGQSAWVFVVDSDNAPSAGSPVKIGSGIVDNPPPAPQNLIASAGVGLANLLWEPVNESDLAGYRAYRSDTADGTYGLVSGLIPEGTHNFTNTGLTAGETYHFKVKAEDDGGNLSPFSNRAQVTIQTDAIAPATPTGLSATGGILNVALSWNPNSESDLKGYNVFRSDKPGGGYKKQNLSLLGNPNYTDTNVAAERTYYYVVNAVDTSGNGSENSAEVSAYVEGEPDTPPAAPTGLAATAAVEAVDLIWNANTESDLDGYYAHRSLVNGGPYTQINSIALTDTFFADTGLTAGVTYHYVVEAVDEGGYRSAYSEPDSAVADAPEVTAPAAPTGLQATEGENEVDLIWYENSELDLLGYYVLRGDEEGGPYTALNAVVQSDTTYSDTDVTPYETYYYVVQAENDGNELSDFSAEVEATPYGAPPAASVLAPDSLRIYEGIVMDLPIYGSNSNYRFGDSFSAATYDSLAEFDVYIFPSTYNYQTKFDDVVDSVRVRNPDFIALNYIWQYGVPVDWNDASSGIEKAIWDMVANNSDGPQTGAIDFILYYADGVDTAKVVANQENYVWNPGAPGLADSLAAFFTDRIAERTGITEYVGVFADYLSSSFDPLVADRDSVDMDEDGWAYVLDPEFASSGHGEEQAYKNYVSSLPGAFRAAAGDSNFLFVANGNAGQLKSLARHFDGSMIELFETNYPTSAAQCLYLMNTVPEYYVNQRTSLPLIFWQSDPDVESGGTSEILASMGRGVSCWSNLDGGGKSEMPTAPSDLKLGRRISEVVASGNELSCYFAGAEHGETLAKVRFTNGSALPWDYIVVKTDPDQHVVLRRSGDWPQYYGWIGY